MRRRVHVDAVRLRRRGILRRVEKRRAVLRSANCVDASYFPAMLDSGLRTAISGWRRIGEMTRILAFSRKIGLLSLSKQTLA